MLCWKDQLAHFMWDVLWIICECVSEYMCVLEIINPCDCYKSWFLWRSLYNVVNADNITRHQQVHEPGWCTHTDSIVAIAGGCFWWSVVLATNTPLPPGEGSQAAFITLRCHAVFVMFHTVDNFHSRKWKATICLYNLHPKCFLVNKGNIYIIFLMCYIATILVFTNSIACFFSHEMC